MRTRLMMWWEGLRESFWFLPALMVLGALGLSAVTVEWDRRADGARGVDLDGYRELLTTVAASMIGLAGVIFSITILTLSLASQQFGPRLLRNFIRNRENQFFLGTFVATFVFAVAVLRAMGNGEELVPRISVATAMVLALLSIGVLVFFFHHTAVSLQASAIVKAVSLELYRGIEALYPESAGEEKPEKDHAGIREEVMRKGVPVTGNREGFIQSIDMEGLVGLAAERDWVIEIVLRPGKFAVTRSALVRVLGEVDEEGERRIQRAFNYGRERQHVQDIEFNIEQLVEVAVRALSPGINDPFTALACLERLGEAYCRLAGRRFPSPYRYDEKGDLRLVAPRPDFAGLMGAGFNQIRQYGAGSVAVITRMIEIVEEIAECVGEANRRTLWEHAGMICRAGLRANEEENDRRDILARYRRTCERLGLEPDAGTVETKER